MMHETHPNAQDLTSDKNSFAQNPETGSVRERLTPESTEINLAGLDEAKQPLHGGTTPPPGVVGVCVRIRRFLRSHLLLVLTLVGVIIGFTLGFTVRLTKPSDDVLMGIGLVGEIFLRLLKMTIIPLIVSSTIAGTASLDPKSNGKIGAICLGYLAFINLLGSLMGLGLGLSIQPGRGIMGHNAETRRVDSLKTGDVMLDMIRNLFPDNVVRASIQKVQTKYVTVEKSLDINSSMLLNNTSVAQETTKSMGFVDSSNILGVIFACVVFGMAAGISGEKGRPFIDFFESSAAVIIIILNWFLWLAPVGICSLIAASVAGIDDLVWVFSKLGMFVIAVVTGVVIQQLIVLPLIHFIIIRRNPYSVLLQMPKAWLIGFASAGSACAMPEMYRICDNNNIDRRVSSYGIPLAVTLNANGSALFICIASLFLAQISFVDLNAGQIATIGVLTTISALALPSVPSSSIVTIVMIMSTMGLPPENLGLLFAVEWFLDRLRTTSSVVGDVYCVYLVQHLCQKDLEEVDRHKPRGGTSPVYSPSLEPMQEEEEEEGEGGTTIININNTQV